MKINSIIPLGIHYPGFTQLYMVWFYSMYMLYNVWLSLQPKLNSSLGFNLSICIFGYSMAELAFIVWSDLAHVPADDGPRELAAPPGAFLDKILWRKLSSIAPAAATAVPARDSVFATILDWICSP